MKLLTHIDLFQNEIRNAVIQPLAVPPSNPRLGQIYYNTSFSKLMHFNGTDWEQVGSEYNLPIATTDSLGGIRIGTGLKVDTATGTVSVSNEGMAVGSADKLTTARKIELTGGATGAANFDGSEDVVIEVSVNGLEDKVDKIDGKGLSTNDFTNAEKEKLDGISAGAQVNVQSDWNATEGDAFILNKPTSLSAFINDTNFIDSTVDNLVNYYKKDDVDSMISAIASLSFEVVEQLPAIEEASSSIIYLVPRENKWVSNEYEEYIYVASAQKFELIGTTAIDLSNYLQKDGDASSVTVDFEAAEERVMPDSGTALSVIIGAITKHLSDLKSVAFSGSYNDLVDVPQSYPHLNIEQFTLSAGQTNLMTETSYETSLLSNVIARDASTGELVLVDWKLNETGNLVVSIASAYDNDIIINVSYLI